jgi:hypothetical protein
MASIAEVLVPIHNSASGKKITQRSLIIQRLGFLRGRYETPGKSLFDMHRPAKSIAVSIPSLLDFLSVQNLTENLN